jgi:ABC-2 type transport system ATP-binding protein
MIEVKDLQKVVEGNTVIDISTLEVRAGETVALVGPAGSGKSTLLELLIGDSRPTAGTIQMAGIDPFQDNEHVSRLVGVLFAEDSLYKHLSPLANLEFHCRLYGLPKSRVTQVLSQVGLADHAGGRSEKLSTGLQRRLAFGRALLHAPKILLLFEPFARCDETTISLLSNVIRQQAGADNAILIFSTDQSHITSISDAIHTLNQGRIVETIHPSEDQSTLPFKIPAKQQDKVVLLNPADILYADTGEGRAFLITAEGRLPTQFTLSELEERLARSGFFRAHRSYLVNLQHVKEVIPFTRNSFSLRLDDLDNTEIPLSKSAAGELRDLLGY